MLAAKPQDFTLNGDKLDAHKIVRCQAVFQAVDPARILGDVAADRTGNLAGRVRRVIKAVSLDRFGDGQVRNAGLRDDTAIVIVDLKNAVEFAKAEKHRICKRQRAARK